MKSKASFSEAHYYHSSVESATYYGTYLIPKIGILELIPKYGLKTYTQLNLAVIIKYVQDVHITALTRISVICYVSYNNTVSIYVCLLV